ncbi:MAG TPA: hypothetical protein VIY71_03135 [Solirubrobacterales bacterium]
MGGKLDDSRRSTTCSKVAPWHAAPNFDYRAVLIQEVEVEREVHAEGMDTGAAGDEQTRTDLVDV